MLDTLIDYSVRSLGLLPLMALVFLGGVAVILERGYFFRRSIRSGATLEHDLRLLERNRLDDAEDLVRHYASAVQVELLKTAMRLKGKPQETLEREIEETIMFQMPRLDRNLWMLDTAVTLGPLLGLLGTILGMIDSFNVLGISGSSNPGAVTGGIAHALIATAIGLTIAIVCVVFLNYFNKRIRLVINQMDLIKSMLVSRFSA